jgi:hypothetical protein
MHPTPYVLQKMAAVISAQGLHTGNQFAAHGPMDKLDICAVAYIVAEQCTPPAVFFTDEVASLELIEASPRAMAAIKAISEVLESAPCETQNEAGLYEADYIEHVSNWAATPAPRETQPPTESEVIGRILRAANHARTAA